MQGLVVDATVQRDEVRFRFELTVVPGETVALVGPIGSGKSTALALVAGRVPAATGRVVGPDGVWDDPAAGIRIAEADRDVTLLVQRPQLLDDVPAVEQVAAALAPPGVHAGAHRDGAAVRAGALLAELGIPSHVAARDGWTLSGGEVQRVALAATVARSARVLLLDDPFGALDARSGRVARHWLAGQLERRAACAVIVCNDPRDAARFASRVVELDGTATGAGN